MTQYDIYGIGNALVDTEIEVDDNELSNLGIEKGCMTLIEKDRLTELLDITQSKPKKQACGGSAANTMIGASQLGLKAYYDCRVGHDKTGEFFTKDLRNSHVDCQTPTHQNTAHTGTCLVMVTKDAERTMNTFLGVSATLNEDDVNEAAIKNAHYVYIEGYLVAVEESHAAAMKAIRLAKKYQSKVAISFSDPNMVTFFKDRIAELLSEKVDIIFCNEDEAKGFTETNDIEDALSELQQYAEIVIITLGSKGAIIQNSGPSIHIQAHDTHAIDSNGAGDCFAAAFLASLSQERSIEASGQIASFAASRVVSKFGPRLGNVEVDEVKNFINSL